MTKIEVLKERACRATDALNKICEDFSLDSGLVGASHWAIVGGAVRDLLLGKETQDPILPSITWPDLDVAVGKGRLDVDKDLLQILDSRPNSFGGLKLLSGSIGSIDLWSWAEDEAPRWPELLSRCDFGVNAVAFCWPERRLVFHDRWRQDVLDGSNPVVENLCPGPMKSIHVVRGIALIMKLKEISGSHVRLGRSFNDDIIWLCNEASRGDIQLACSYLERKISEGRWPRKVELVLKRMVMQASRKSGLNESETKGRLEQFFLDPG